ncbi:MAG: DUF3244 domain-containing protein [Paludibacter sp.]
MKTLNSLLFASLMVLLVVLPFQSIFAVVDVPLKSSDDPRTTFPKVKSKTPTHVATSAVFANLSDTELILSFNGSVGAAQITVEDEMGGIVYMYSLDTNSSSELVIPLDGWDNGRYRINISYGTTKLVGDFNF